MAVIWLGDQGGKVVRIEPPPSMDELVTSDIAINGGSFNVRNLAPGPDGNVWATGLRWSGRAGRRPPALRQPSTCRGGGAWDITLGPEGNLWYTVPDGNNSKIGRITPAGESARQFDVTDAGDPLGITAGPDGASLVRPGGGATTSAG